MRRRITIWNVVCAAPGVGPTGFGVDDFAEQVGFGDRIEAVLLGDVSVTEWQKARLQILPEQLNLGFAEKDADSAFVRTAVEAFLARLDGLVPDAPIGFNVALRLTLSEDEADPSRRHVDAPALADLLGGTGGRGGLHLVYNDSLSRWWVEIRPKADDERVWVYDLNRHFADFPDAGEERDAILDWFADADARAFEQFEIISGEGRIR